jgi:Staphylococcal nuclease homologue
VRGRPVGALAARPSFADVAGPATVIDGDTLVVAGERVRLEGIDASEIHQTCTAYGQEWARGRTSAEWLKEHLNGRQVECIGHARDRYRRLLAVCYVGGEDLSERLVREGWALDFRRYSTDYLQAEAEGRRHLAWRVHPAMGVARRAPLTGYARRMVWPGQDPRATDVILHLNVPYAGASPAYLEIDKLPDGRYRATVGTLFEHQEICRTGDLEALVRQANLMASCRSFDDVMLAFRAMRTLG